ncbi:contact-dependent growth inhibition system immunity protein [Flavisolibacter nicotianae]|uniref:contact-dependent growth inhibition system immunity protein n=1 Tax=Flavisolibacter nicotianae TaxID=2364882 RepID=UPI000EB09CF7|nr:contact-dependent growth inhibition system immunity protein [Flavisolibacter nicotianae]
MQEHRSIEQLENDYWQEVSFPSSLVERCFNYRKVPVSELTTEQLRLLIGQQIGLRFTIPKAINVLQADVLAEGDYYPGDLLNSLLGLSEEGWNLYPNEKIKFVELLRQNISTIERTENKELIRKTKDYLS